MTKRATLSTHLWAFWTATRASAEYVAGRIDGDEWHTRVGIARLSVGREVADWPEAEEEP